MAAGIATILPIPPNHTHPPTSAFPSLRLSFSAIPSPPHHFPHNPIPSPHHPSIPQPSLDNPTLPYSSHHPFISPSPPLFIQSLPYPLRPSMLPNMASNLLKEKSSRSNRESRSSCAALSASPLALGRAHHETESANRVSTAVSAA